MKYLLVLLFIQVITSWNIDNFPDPRYDFELCGRVGREGTLVCDPDLLLTEETRDFIDDVNLEILAETNSPCDTEDGFKPLFIIMKKMDDYIGNCWTT